MNKLQVEYIWLDAENKFRSKVRFLEHSGPHASYKYLTLSDIPLWNFDGSSTGQATTSNSEVILQPVQLYLDNPSTLERKDPTFHYYVLCETMVYDTSNNLIPHPTNSRFPLRSLNEDTWFGFEQEFFILHLFGGFVNFPQDCSGQGPYYCNIEPTENMHSLHIWNCPNTMRKCTERIAKRCIDLGLGITGWNLEVAPAQTEIQIFGKGIRACDDIIMMRYLTFRVLNEYNMKPIFSAKPLGPDWNGSGLHTNISTSLTRNENGFEHILKIMNAFEKYHKEHLEVYGNDNHLRLTGIHETSSMDKFSWGIGSRDTSVRIPRETFLNKKGYFEDRRPAADADPYKIAHRVMTTLNSINT